MLALRSPETGRHWWTRHSHGMKLPETRGERIRWAVIAVAAIAVFWFISSRFDQLDLQQILEDVSRTLGDWTYPIAGLLAFLETGAFVGLVVPGETFVILAGAVAGQGVTNLYLTIAIVWFSAWAGDSTSFVIGKRLGRGFIERHGPRVRITPERFRQVETYFDRHGGKTILIGRFIGLVRALAPFVAGSSGMEYRAFLPYSVLGTGLWAGTFTVLGYVGSRSIQEIADRAGTGILVFGITVGVIVAIVVSVRFLREAENRRRVVEWMEQRTLLRPLVALGRRLQPQARFVWNRLTPGGLGLELTAVVATLAVALFVFVAFAAIFTDDPGPTPGDEAAFDVAAEVRTGWLTDVAKAVTTLGSTSVTLPIAAVAAILLGARRRWTELAVLVVALAVAHLGVPLVKDAIERPRPGGALVGSSGSAYPSGHATWSVLYVWLALTVALRLRPGKVGGTALVIGAIALAAAIGLSRVYLRVHYLSDSSGGWAFGVSAFALCAVVALVATHLRRAPKGGGDPPGRRTVTPQ
jgi:membrane protein DedA with SNARE-associated domain/membrane-associated phospholipid phosphatase